ncbi:MAG: RNA-binding cell elongation regulator Jag/EloR [Bacillota bacterium]
MDVIKQEAKNVDDAINLALEKLNISREEAEVTVLNEGSRGLLGLIGAKNAVVEVKPKVNPVKIGLNFLEDVFINMPVEVELEVLEEQTNSDQVVYNIKSKDLGIIIGHRGETLDAIQYLTSLVVNKETNSYFRVLIDAEGYRDRRQQTLERLAKRLAEKALSTGRKVMLEPMPPHERRIIHMTLRKDKRVNTFSDGREPFRKVMIEVNK